MIAWIQTYLAIATSKTLLFGIFFCAICDLNRSAKNQSSSTISLHKEKILLEISQRNVNINLLIQKSI